jgi:NAD(P)-dependent dehydrogenase (short-subunit alcohol dehydrogenase family)
VSEAISFAGRVAIVTGAGNGIGRQHALELARRGAKVLVNDYGGDTFGHGGGPEAAEAVVAEIREAGGTAVANWSSVASTKGCNGMVAQAIEAFGRLDILINNAGISRAAYIEDTTDEDWDAVIATHLTGSFKTTRAAWPHMKAQRYGRIVYTASSTGEFGSIMLGNYAAAKAGVTGLMNIAALEGEPHGILCNAIMPNALTRLALQSAKEWEGQFEPEEMTLPPETGNSFNPEFNTPIAVYLASEQCGTTHQLYSQCLGRTARAVVGVVPGWQAQRQSPPTVEQIAEHWQEIVGTPTGVAEPMTSREELAVVLAASAGPR